MAALKSKNDLNVLVFEAHWNNRGDEAAIRAMIDSLRSRLPVKKMEMVVLSKKLGYFPYNDIELLVLDPSIRGKPSRVLSFGIDVFLTLITFGRLAFTSQRKKFISMATEADVAIHAPGVPSIGDFNCGLSGIGRSNYPRVGLNEIPYFYALLILILKKKPIFLYGISIGPFSGKLRNLIRACIFKRVTAIIPRDKTSVQFLKDQLGLNCVYTADSVFQDDIHGDYLQRARSNSDLLDMIYNNKVVGMTITDLKWHPAYKNNSTLRQQIIKSFVNVTRFLIAKGYYVLLIPETFGEVDELAFLEYIRRFNEEKIRLLPQNLDSNVQQVIISELFCLINMRYHPNVFASKANVPFIAIGYGHKTEDLMERLQLLDLLIPINEVNSNEIITRFLYLEQNYARIKEHLKKMNPEMRAMSQETTQIVIENLIKLGLVASKDGFHSSKNGRL